MSVTELYPVLHLPPTLASVMRFRPAEDAAVRPGPAFNGADLRLVLIIWTAYAQQVGNRNPGLEVTIPQRVITHHLGRVHRDRLIKSITRIGNTEVWDGKAWHRLLASVRTTPGVKTHPKVPVGDDWHFGLQEGLASAIRRDLLSLSRWHAFAIEASDLQQLESKHSVTLYCRYRAWTSGYAKPTGTDGWAMHPSGKGISLDVPAADLGPAVFGYDGTLPPSQVHRLFVTEGQKPAVMLELRRVMVDMQVAPLTSAFRGDHAYEVRVGDIVRKEAPKSGGLAQLKEELDMGKTSGARKKMTHRRKRGVVTRAAVTP